MNPIHDFGLILSLRKIMKREKPDIVLSYTIKPNIYCSLVSAITKTKVIVNVSGLGTVFLWKGIVKRLATGLYQLAFRHSAWVFFQNEDDRREFLRVVSIDSQKTSLLPGSGIDLKKFTPVDPVNNHPPKLLMISRLIIEKGILDFIEAVKIIKQKGINAEFQLIGDLPEGHKRSITQEELDLWIVEGLITYVAHTDDVRPYIADADAVVLPSYREGTPRTLLEAAAMAKPLIATNVPGCNQVVIDELNGFLCEPQNPSDLAAKLEAFIAMEDQDRRTMGLQSRALVEKKYDVNKVVALYENKIRELTS